MTKKIAFTVDLWERVADIAEGEGMSAAAFIREAAEAFLEIYEDVQVSV